MNRNVARIGCLLFGFLLGAFASGYYFTSIEHATYIKVYPAVDVTVEKVRIEIDGIVITVEEFSEFQERLIEIPVEKQTSYSISAELTNGRTVNSILRSVTHGQLIYERIHNDRIEYQLRAE